MDPFVIQPTYALHSLLRPNRTLDVGVPRAERACENHGKDPHMPACGEAGRELCDA